MNLPKTLNKKYHHMIESYEYCTYDKLHDVVLKKEFDNGNDGKQLLEPTVKDLNAAFAKCTEIVSKEEVEEIEEVKEEKIFKVGQKFRMEKVSGGVGVREAEILKLETRNGKQTALVMVGKTAVRATIKGEYLLYPYNMRAYLNTKITDLIK